MKYHKKEYNLGKNHYSDGLAGKRLYWSDHVTDGSPGARHGKERAALWEQIEERRRASPGTKLVHRRTQLRRRERLRKLAIMTCSPNDNNRVYLLAPQSRPRWNDECDRAEGPDHSSPDRVSEKLEQVPDTGA